MATTDEKHYDRHDDLILTHRFFATTVRGGTDLGSDIVAEDDLASTEDELADDVLVGCGDDGDDGKEMQEEATPTGTVRGDVADIEMFEAPVSDFGDSTAVGGGETDVADDDGLEDSSTLPTGNAEKSSDEEEEEETSPSLSIDENSSQSSSGSGTPLTENESCIDDLDETDAYDTDNVGTIATPVVEPPLKLESEKTAAAPPPLRLDTAAPDEESAVAVASPDPTPPTQRLPAVVARLRKLIRGIIVPALGVAAVALAIGRSGIGPLVAHVSAKEAKEIQEEKETKTKTNGIEQLAAKIASGELIDAGNGMYLPGPAMTGGTQPAGNAAGDAVGGSSGRLRDRAASRAAVSERRAEEQKRKNARIAELRSKTFRSISEAQAAEEEIANLEGKGILEKMISKKVKPDNYVPLSDDEFKKAAQERFRNK
eukprot:CAMPEP_0113301406 /NCGR_PEP_ID=MMETSP0010_2-20120614/2649_1 /TAXON_ID=216773 ORGANISM="Corethron hystrix, Strain 308" /NCGR_SAMPLE_ID=MMETSP0010_2 /ASSEMBLY_ACC=CAM_ASM_000155 /LENGTH=427 /DNA_ID=CAMNT_0000155025 /DNA_START=275 /DNA_END=1559 /DNA_ORIENTATION=- /assembly_acc=CAM_ASM_000155